MIIMPPNSQLNNDLLASAMALLPHEKSFHWQRGLLQKLLGGDTPCALEIPTGLGKGALLGMSNSSNQKS
jgi:hypothetical protein